MTRKDYKLIAEIFRSLKPEEGMENYTRWLITLEDFERHAKLDNARFDKTKFRKACGFFGN